MARQTRRKEEFEVKEPVDVIMALDGMSMVRIQYHPESGETEALFINREEDGIAPYVLYSLESLQNLSKALEELFSRIASRGTH